MFWGCFYFIWLIKWHHLHMWWCPCYHVLKWWCHLLRSSCESFFWFCAFAELYSFWCFFYSRSSSLYCVIFGNKVPHRSTDEFKQPWLESICSYKTHLLWSLFDISVLRSHSNEIFLLAAVGIQQQKMKRNTCHYCGIQRCSVRFT